MSWEAREFRRMAGMFAARMPDLRLSEVEDPRNRRGRRWHLEVVLRTALIGIAAGCQSAAEVESLTSRMSRPLRLKLGIRRRLPDTTLREVLTRLCPYEVRERLRELIRSAWVRKALPLDGLPFHALALDGKGTPLDVWDNHYAQRHTTDEKKSAYGLARTVTALLFSTPAKTIVDCFPIPAETNEMGIFPHAFDAVLRKHGKLFQLVTYDAGVPSADNCQHVVDAGKDFFFRVKNEAWLMFRDFHRLFDKLPLERAMAQTEDVLSNNKSTLRSVFVAKAPQGSGMWKIIRSLIRVNVQTLVDGQVVREEDKYYISSLAPDRLCGKQWLFLSRGHWGVENNGHWTLDAIFKEDERPWFRSSAKGTVIVMVLRRIVYSMLALFRAVTLRSEENRTMPWKRLMTWVSDTLIAITAEQLEGLDFSEVASVFR